NTITIREKRAVVVASCGGHPFDIDLIQAHKTLDAAAGACADGGTILLFAECEEGLGRHDMAQWFMDGNSVAGSSAIAARLCENYKVNGQTAWSIRRKAERFDIKMAAALSDSQLELIGFERLIDTGKFLKDQSGYLIPNGAKVRFELAANG